MADRKADFLKFRIHEDWVPIIENLEDETAGEIFKYLLCMMTGRDAEPVDPIAEVAIEFILAGWRNED